MIKATAELNFQLSQRNIDQLLRRVQTQMKGVDLRINTSKASKDIDDLGKSLHRATGFAGQFGLAVGESARKFSAYALAATTISKMAGLFSSATAEVLKFDKDLVKLTQVTGKFGAELDGITQHLLDLSVRTGISIGKLGELTTTLAQADLKGRDLANAIEVIAKSDLAPSFENMTDSVEGLIAIMQQFKRPSYELIKQFGYINQLSKQSAVESADLIEAVKRSGSVFESAGASLEEFAAMMAVVRSTTRESAETIATGLKTIVERIQRPEIIDQLRQLGVELETVEGKFVGPRLAFERLSEALRKRGSLEKGSFELINVAKEIGGGRQLSKLIPLLNSGTQSARMMERAMQGAATSIDDDAAIAMKSLSKQIDVLKAKFTKFFVEFSLSDEFKEMAKAALTFADAMLEVLKATKPFIPLASQIGTFIGARYLYQGFSGKRTPRFKTATPDGYYSGGRINDGSGQPGVDDVLIAGAKDEFMMSKRASRGIGYANLEYMNRTGKLPHLYAGGRVGGGLGDSVSGAVAGFGGLIALQVALNSMSGDASDSAKSMQKLSTVIAGGIPIFFLMFNGFKVLNNSLTQLNEVIAARNAKSVLSKELSTSGITGYSNQTRVNLLNAGQSGDPNKFKSVSERVAADPLTKSITDAGGSKALAKFGRRKLYDLSNTRGDLNQARDEAYQAIAKKYEQDLDATVASVDAGLDNAQKAFNEADAKFKAMGVRRQPIRLSVQQAKQLRDSLESVVLPNIEELQNQANIALGDANFADARKKQANKNFEDLSSSPKGTFTQEEATSIRREKREAGAYATKINKIARSAQAELDAGNAAVKKFELDQQALKSKVEEVRTLKRLRDTEDALEKARKDQLDVVGKGGLKLRETEKLIESSNKLLAQEKELRNKRVAKLRDVLGSDPKFSSAVINQVSGDSGLSARSRREALARSNNRLKSVKATVDDASGRVGSERTFDIEERQAAAEARFRKAFGDAATLKDPDTLKTRAYDGPRGRGFRARAAGIRREESEALAEYKSSTAALQDLATIATGKETLSRVRKRIKALKDLIASDESLAKEQNKNVRLTKSRQSQLVQGAKAGIFSRGFDFLQKLRNTPRESLSSRAKRYGSQAGAFVEQNSSLIGGVLAGAVAVAASALNQLAESARKNIDEAIANGDAQSAYRESLVALEAETKSSDIMYGAGAGAGVGAAIGTFVVPALGTAVGAAVGGGIGALTASFQKISDKIYETIFASDRSSLRDTEAKANGRLAGVAGISKTINDSLTKFAERTGPDVTDRSTARVGLAKGITTALSQISGSEDTSVPLSSVREELMRQYDAAAQEIRMLGDAAVKNGEGLEYVSRRAPELSKAFLELTKALSDEGITERTQLLLNSIAEEARVRNEESAARARALQELELQIAYQKRLSSAIKFVSDQTVSISKTAENLRTVSEAISGDVSARSIKEFGVSLVDADNYLSAEFHATIDALGTFNDEIKRQSNLFRDMVIAGRQFEQTLPAILNNVTPADKQRAGEGAIRSIFGRFGDAMVNDLINNFRTMIAEQGDAGGSALAGAEQVKDFAKSALDKVVGRLGSDIESVRTKEVNDRLTALSEKITAETDIRANAISKLIEANAELESFGDSFRNVSSAELRGRRLSAANTALRPLGQSTTANSVADFQRLSLLKKSLVEQLNEINTRKKNNQLTEAEVTLQGKLVGDINLLSKALGILTDTSEELSKVQEEISQNRDAQSKLRSKASELAFGGSDARNQFARALTAQKFVAAGGNLQSLPAEIRGELYSFLQEFGDSKVFNGQSGTEIINKQTANFLKGLGFSNDQAMSLITDMVPIEQRQLEELKKIVANTAAGEVARFSTGGQARGTDTVPAMLTPGEFIVSRNNARRNKGILNDINNGATYAFTGGEINTGGGIKKTSGIKTPLQLYNENQERLKKAKAAKEIGTMKKDKSLEGASESTRNRLLLGIDKADQFAAEKKQMDQFLAELPADGSISASQIIGRASKAETGNKEINKAYRSMGQGYDTRRQKDYGTGGMTAAEKEAVARKHAEYIVSGGAATDPTGLGKRFNKDSILLYGMEGGNGPLSPTRGQSGLGNKLGLDRYEQQATGFKPAEMLRIADEKARNPEAAIRASRSRERDLADIAARRQAKLEGRDTYGVTAKNPMGTPRPVRSESVKPAVRASRYKIVDRLLESGSKKLKFASANSDIITPENFKAFLDGMLSPDNLLSTKRGIGFKGSDAELNTLMREQINKLSNDYSSVVKVLFGSGEGTNGNSLGQSLFTNPVFRNGVFDSAMVNQQYLVDNKDKVKAILPQLNMLSRSGSSQLGSYIDKLSNKRFSKTMSNLNDAVSQAMNGGLQMSTDMSAMHGTPAEQRAFDAKMRAEHKAFMDALKTSGKGKIEVPQSVMDEYGTSTSKPSNAQATKEFLDRQANSSTEAQSFPELSRRAARNAYSIPNYAGKFFNGGIVGGMSGKDNNVAHVTQGEGILRNTAMNKIGPKAFNHLNKTGEMPQDQLKSTVDSFMKTPPWMKDFQSSVATLAGTSIKAELAPVSINVKINGAEVLASIQGQMKDLVRKELMSAILNIYHDNSGRHVLKGMPNGIY